MMPPQPLTREAAAERFAELLDYADQQEDHLLGALLADARQRFEDEHGGPQPG